MHMMSYLQIPIAYLIAYAQGLHRILGKQCTTATNENNPWRNEEIHLSHWNIIWRPTQIYHRHIIPPEYSAFFPSFFLKIWQWTCSVSRVGIKYIWITEAWQKWEPCKHKRGPAEHIYQWFYRITTSTMIYSIPAKVSQIFLHLSSSCSSIGK